MKIDLILLAGGVSRRFAAISRESEGKKLLADFDGKPLFQYAFDAARAVSHLCRVLAVTREPAIREEALCRGFCPVEAPPPDEGMAASMRAGILKARADAALCFFVCDEPYFTGELLYGFLEAYAGQELPLGRVKSGNRFGSPTIFAPMFREELLSIRGDEGGRSLLKRYPDRIFYYDVPERALTDFDTPWAHRQNQ
ncbi:MAG TPA: nucleotidyltransferase family protein [Candidatus Merdivicinus excrementipullorum]|uniref:Nucleotidyltransferase family protein n=1 Tax=Candidatus Merdivicinus excrementipullorum TaxID=2840867 RepID=A0A9D1FNB9_9FIRM|nr:nucleotidyltransferase family protein [Candidatus Merdivicinus excrementipullorum]